MAKTPIIPFPPQSSRPTPEETKAWMNSVTTFLRTLLPENTISAPPIVLASLQKDDRAGQDGILMFDRVTNSLVISINGQWMPIFAGEAYGGMRTADADVPVADITTAWSQIVGYSENMLPSVGTVFDVISDRITFLKTGIYSVNLYESIKHNNSGQARELETRFRNAITGATSRTASVATGSGDRTTALAYTFLTNIGPSQVGQPYVLEASAPIGNYTSVVRVGSAISAARIAYVPI